jgi:hypothetical protein
MLLEHVLVGEEVKEVIIRIPIIVGKNVCK